jgi:hypothetical protein
MAKELQMSLNKINQRKTFTPGEDLGREELL